MDHPPADPAAVPPLPARIDVLVVGAGHAGVEAALAASRLGARVVVVTLRLDAIGQMSCNPAVGGVGKGHLVREIDALGGAMGQVADATALQARRLNLSRGPAVRATRVQSDAAAYREAMGRRLRDAAGVTLLADEVVDLALVSDAAGRRVDGVRCRQAGLLRAGAVVITTGTFLGGLCHIGATQFGGGRMGDAPANALSTALTQAGLQLRRFKTGTTPRLLADSIAWEALEVQHGDAERPFFSFDPPSGSLPQRPCHITHTTVATHRLVRDNLHLSALYGGRLEGRGPRYCPSLEDKVVRFADKASHQIFLEPEGLASPRIYPNGLSTSLPQAVQEAFVRTLPGCARARILQPGYAVEYDYAPPTQLFASLMTKAVRGLFLAGQINGTSGYEEAAAQGLMGGLNAARFAAGMAPVRLRRDQAYIGVLIDDLVTRGVDEPYRMFCSRAEHRLTLREGTAEARLTGVGAQWGLLAAPRQAAAAARAAARQGLQTWLAAQRPNAALREALGLGAGATAMRLDALVRRPDVCLAAMLAALRGRGVGVPEGSAQACQDVEDGLRYAGYIAREAREIARLQDMEDVALPPDLPYADSSGLSRELQEKLTAVRPTTLGQASRIPGMTPVALSLLRVHLHRRVA